MKKRCPIGLSVALVAGAATSFAGTVTGSVKCRGLRDNANAVVYLEKVQGTFEAPKEHAVVDQENLVFNPFVLPIVVGTTVDFLNSDTVSHNVFTPDKCAGKFNFGSYASGKSRSYTFTEKCSAVILCNVHSEMEAYVLVLDNPYFAVTDKAGSFKIEGAPAGTYSLVVWHNKLKPSKQEVTIPADGSIEVALEARR